MKKTTVTYRLLHGLYRWFFAFGIDLRKFGYACLGLPRYFWNFSVVVRQNFTRGHGWFILPSFPELADRRLPSGTIKGHYFHQDLLVARKIFERNPRHHMDVGSRIDGLVAHLAVFRSVDVIDIRPNRSAVPNIVFVQGDITAPLPLMAGQYDSVSCLHAIEHFGLGRYGDTVDIGAVSNGFAGLAGLLIPSGILYLSVPIGRRRIDFDAHRVFKVDDVLAMAAPSFSLIEFSFVDDQGDLTPNADPSDLELNKLEYGCGIFELKLRSAPGTPL